MRKRSYAQSSKSRSQSAKPATKKFKTTVRLSALRNPHRESIARSLRTKVTYADYFSINPGSGLGAGYIFSANGLFDPNITGGGHQPVGFDELSEIYTEYVVVGSTITLRAVNQNAGYGLLTLSLYRSAATIANIDLSIENGNCVTTTVGPTGSGQEIKSLNYYCDMNKESLHKDITQEESFAGTQNANPAEGRFYVITLAPFDNAADLGAMNFRVEINYDVIWRDRGINGGS